MANDRIVVRDESGQRVSLRREIDSGRQMVVKKESDLDLVHQTDPVPDPELKFAVGANEVWWFRARLLGDPIQNNGIRGGVIVPDGSTVDWFDSTNLSPSTFNHAIDTDLILTGGPALQQGFIEGYVYAGETAGDVVLAFSQNVDVECHCSIRVHSFLEARRLA